MELGLSLRPQAFLDEQEDEKCLRDAMIRAKSIKHATAAFGYHEYYAIMFVGVVYGWARSCTMCIVQMLCATVELGVHFPCYAEEHVSTWVLVECERLRLITCQITTAVSFLLSTRRNLSKSGWIHVVCAARAVIMIIILASLDQDYVALVVLFEMCHSL